jgi:tetratricopeptide (TPR) repeat protein
MALDQIPEQNTDLKYQFFSRYFHPNSLLFCRFKVRENIASTHILMDQYGEAAQAYEAIVQDRPNYRSSLNLLLCYQTLGERDKTRRAFTDLLKIPFLSSDDDYQATVKDIAIIFFVDFSIILGR